ncbi:MAG: MerR family transcriptional regulator [Chloroflexota bacterium]
MRSEDRDPCYVISIAARMAGVHAQTLRYYEKMGLVAPLRSRGNIRIYSDRDIERIRQIKGLMEDLGVNLAGVEVILRMKHNIARMEEELRSLELEIERLSGGEA